MIDYEILMITFTVIYLIVFGLIVSDFRKETGTSVEDAKLFLTFLAFVFGAIWFLSVPFVIGYILLGRIDHLKNKGEIK